MTTATEVRKTDSKTALKKRAVHEGVTLPSGAYVTVRIPSIEQMVKAGSIPNHLIEAAVKVQREDPQTTEEAKKLIEETWEFTEFIIPEVLVEPKIEAEDVKDLDPRDIQMLADFAARRDDMDAVGHQLGGLETQKSFREHRGIPDFNEIVESLS